MDDAALEDAVGIQDLLGHPDADAPCEHVLGFGRRLGAGVEDAFEDPAQSVPARHLETRPPVKRRIDALRSSHEPSLQPRHATPRTKLTQDYPAVSVEES